MAENPRIRGLQHARALLTSAVNQGSLDLQPARVSLALAIGLNQRLLGLQGLQPASILVIEIIWCTTCKGSFKISNRFSKPRTIRCTIYKGIINLSDRFSKQAALGVQSARVVLALAVGLVNPSATRCTIYKGILNIYFGHRFSKQVPLGVQSARVVLALAIGLVNQVPLRVQSTRVLLTFAIGLVNQVPPGVQSVRVLLTLAMGLVK